MIEKNKKRGISCSILEALQEQLWSMDGDWINNEGKDNDPDSTTINRWWENDAQNSVIYYGLTPKF